MGLGTGRQLEEAAMPRLVSRIHGAVGDSSTDIICPRSSFNAKEQIMAFRRSNLVFKHFVTILYKDIAGPAPRTSRHHQADKRILVAKDR